jgi:hypothetical protein
MGNLSDTWNNNTCITVNPGAILASNDCNAASPNDGHVPIFSQNRYANPSGVYAFKCGKQTWVRGLRLSAYPPPAHGCAPPNAHTHTTTSRLANPPQNLTTAQAMGVDVGSVLVPLPSTADIVAAGRALLQF